MTAQSRIVILVLALLGLAFAGASTWVHYKLLTDAPYISPCDISSTFNCSQVYLSPYGSSGGVPVAIGGHVLVCLVAAHRRVRPASARAQAGGQLYLRALDVGMAAILYLGHSSFSMKTACMLCIGTYVSVVGIFLTSGASPSIPDDSGSRPYVQRPRSLHSKKPAVSVVALAILRAPRRRWRFFRRKARGRSAGGPRRR